MIEVLQKCKKRSIHPVIFGMHIVKNFCRSNYKFNCKFSYTYDVINTKLFIKCIKIGTPTRKYF